MKTIEIIENRLNQAFTPHYLKIQDDKDKHLGHVGSQNGAGHYTIAIEASSFENKTRIAVHRQIYQVLADLMPYPIHALSIKWLNCKT